MTGRILCFLLAALALTATLALAQAPMPPARPGLFPTAYTHFSQKEPIGDLLADFARQEGYRAEISPAISGSISGQFKDMNPAEFLEGLRSAFGVHWYILEGQLSFFHESEWTSRLIRPGQIDTTELKKRLNTPSLVSAQLPLREEPGGGLTLKGPPAYVERLVEVAETVQTYQPEPKMVMRVFKLKFAQADDTTINSMDRAVTIPGVASLLNSMMFGNTGQTTGTTVTQEKVTVQKLRGSGLSSRGQPPAETMSERMPSGGNIMADPRINAVLIHDLEERMPYYEQVIQDLDREVHLVEIHAAIVDINTDFKRDLGITYQGADHDNNWTTGGEVSPSPGGPFPVVPDLGLGSGQGGVLSTVYTHGASFFVARVRALEEEGEARILGRPSVMTIDNMEATLENTTTYYIEVAGQEEVDLFKVESGTVLRVTPHIIERGPNQPPTIRMMVSIQDDQDGSQSQTTSGNMAIPPIKQTKINTQALIDIGQSLLIGGYYFEQRKNGESGVPVLKSIPGLGHLFKSSTKNSVQMERMVLITPRIIRVGEAPTLPSHLDDENFHRDSTQAHYEPRPVKPAPGGCLRH